MKQLNPDHFRLQDAFKSTGKFRLTSNEIGLINDQLARSNQAMVDLLSEEFVLSDDSVSEELTLAEISQIITDVCRLTSSSSAAS